MIRILGLRLTLAEPRSVGRSGGRALAHPPSLYHATPRIKCPRNYKSLSVENSSAARLVPPAARAGIIHINEDGEVSTQAASPAAVVARLVAPAVQEGIIHINEDDEVPTQAASPAAVAVRLVTPAVQEGTIHISEL